MVRGNLEQHLGHHLLIQTDQIIDWRDLQNRVAQLFTEMGYLTTTPKIVELAGRGRKEVDVYVEDPRASVNQVMLIECKLWNASVSQDTVHSMQTVMAGSGANTGFIVSKAGFQKGAYEAATNTNIHLLTWEELQHKFGRQWFLHRRDALKLLVSELKGIDGAYLDQMNPLMTISNTMQFEAWSAIRPIRSKGSRQPARRGRIHECVTSMRRRVAHMREIL